MSGPGTDVQQLGVMRPLMVHKLMRAWSHLANKGWYSALGFCTLNNSGDVSSSVSVDWGFRFPSPSKTESLLSQDVQTSMRVCKTGVVINETDPQGSPNDTSMWSISFRITPFRGYFPALNHGPQAAHPILYYTNPTYYNVLNFLQDSTNGTITNRACPRKLAFCWSRMPNARNAYCLVKCR